MKQKDECSLHTIAVLLDVKFAKIAVIFSKASSSSLPASSCLRFKEENQSHKFDILESMYK
jgi:hypothetical protein